jgi:hypothetical protein
MLLPFLFTKYYYHLLKNLCSVELPIVLVEWLTLLLRFSEVEVSNLGPETGYTDLVFRGFPQSL